MKHYTYFLLLLITIAFPLSRTFDYRLHFYKNWKPLLAGLLPTAAFFLVWDHYFTRLGVWSFNPEYVSGIYIAQLPVEEWLFFFVIPYSCVFIYESVIHYLKKDVFHKISAPITILLIVVNLSVGIVYHDRWYTSVNLLANGIFLLIHLLVFGVKYLGRFYVAYLFSLLGFFLVNGVLTALPVVIYNNKENLGIRLGTIPVEDTMYAMLLLIMNITIYEFVKDRLFEKKMDHSSIQQNGYDYART